MLNTLQKANEITIAGLPLNQGSLFLYLKINICLFLFSISQFKTFANQLTRVLLNYHQQDRTSRKTDIEKGKQYDRTKNKFTRQKDSIR